MKAPEIMQRHRAARIILEETETPWWVPTDEEQNDSSAQSCGDGLPPELYTRASVAVPPPNPKKEKANPHTKPASRKWFRLRITEEQFPCAWSPGTNSEQIWYFHGWLIRITYLDTNAAIDFLKAKTPQAQALEPIREKLINRLRTYYHYKVQVAGDNDIIIVTRYADYPYPTVKRETIKNDKRKWDSLRSHRNQTLDSLQGPDTSIMTTAARKFTTKSNPSPASHPTPTASPSPSKPTAGRTTRRASETSATTEPSPSNASARSSSGRRPARRTPPPSSYEAKQNPVHSHLANLAEALLIIGTTIFFTGTFILAPLTCFLPDMETFMVNTCITGGAIILIAVIIPTKNIK